VAILSSRTIWTITLATFALATLRWVFFSWFYLYLAKVRGLNLKSSALYATLPFLAMAVCSPLGGAIGDWITKRTNSSPRALRHFPCWVFLYRRFHYCRICRRGRTLRAWFSREGPGSLYLTQSSFWAVFAEPWRQILRLGIRLDEQGEPVGGMLTSLSRHGSPDKFGWKRVISRAAAVAVLGRSFGWGLIPEHRYKSVRQYKCFRKDVEMKVRANKAAFGTDQLGRSDATPRPGDVRVSTARQFRVWERRRRIQCWRRVAYDVRDELTPSHFAR